MIIYYLLSLFLLIIVLIWFIIKLDYKSDFVFMYSFYLFTLCVIFIYYEIIIALN